MSRPTESSATGSRGEFAELLRELRLRAGLTQQELANAAGISLRRANGLERGGASMPQRETVRLLADALSLAGAGRDRFETAARGRPLEVVPAAATAAAMRSLPRDVASFTGRQRELDQLVKAAETAGGVVGIHAIGGMAGVGKTAFALHAAHQLAGRFPGGQVFLPLHGHTPGRAPVDPADALASLLLAIGVPAGRVPPGLEERAALWRDQVAGRPLLLVLDDAASSDQVHSLLPGAGGSLVLITSRRHLSALDDATAISLDTLPSGDAAALLARLAARPGMRPGDPGVREIIRLCGHLPLAIGMLGRQLRHHPAWTAARRAAELAAARNRLALMETENLSVAAAFDLSYSDLTEEQQRLFRRLGLHPGAAIDSYAAAALDGTSLPAARRGLDALYDRYLLMESAQGRYRLHDLIREHARALGGRHDPEDDRDAVTVRLLDYYQHTAAVANVRITRRTRPSPAAAADADGRMPAAVPVLADMEQALDWARAERASLLDCLDYAAGAGWDARVVSLTAGISGLLQHDGPWADAIFRQTAAARAAQSLGDRLGHASALCDLGEARRLAGDFPAAAHAQQQALGLYRGLGDRLGQANALSCLGAVWQVTADYPAAAAALEQALGLYHDLGDRLGQASALNQLGTVRWVAGDYPPAAQALEQALGVCRDLGDRLGQARAITNLGAVWAKTGDLPAAAHAQQQALGLYRELGARRGQANALMSLGTVLQRTGDYPGAAQAQEEALGILRDLGDPVGHAHALSNLAVIRQLTGDLPAAGQAMDEALGMYREIGDRGSEAEVLNDRGALHRVSGEVAAARESHQRSLELSREIDSAWDEAHALAGLGRCALADGDIARAESLLRQALEIFERIGAAEAPELRAELDALDRPGGGARVTPGTIPS